MEIRNDFMVLRSVVKSAVQQYRDLRKRIDWKDTGKSATIERLAKPFLDGYFTIAVAGKMSAGKSTFINSLIGEELLPTGHFQTTSGITWIVSSNKREMEVKYADGHTAKFNGNLAEELKKIVAVPEEFDALPINHINKLIKGNDNISEILRKKPGIEGMTHTSSSEALWRKYVAATPKSKIAEKVVLYLQLPPEYEGWRIVDTPGVGAIGGIQDDTKLLLTSKDGESGDNTVDAVVLLHKGTENIQDESANTFAEEVKKSLGSLAKGRLFFVLTHGASSEFANHKDGILSRANVLFGERLGIAKDKITYLDSVVQRLVNDIKKYKRDFSTLNALQTPLNGWTTEEWSTAKAILSQLYCNLMMDGVECSNSTILTELEGMARFNEFRNLLYDFLNKEKEVTFDKLLTMIEDELNVYGKVLQQNIVAVSNGQKGIDAQIKANKEEETELNKALVKVQQKATPQSIKRAFDFIDTDLAGLSNKQTISEVRTRYLEIIAKGLETERRYFQNLISEFKRFSNEFKNQDTTFKSIDFGELERIAQGMAIEQVTDYTRAEKKLVKKGGISSEAEYKDIYPHTKDKVDEEKKRREFTALVVREGRSHCQAYIKGIETKSREFFTLTKKNIDDKISEANEKLNTYKRDLDKQDQLLKGLKADLKAVEEVKKNLKSFSND